MFEDLITSKPKIIEAKLGKNGTIIESAVVDISDYVSKGEGYITCDGLDIQATDEFRIHIVYKKATDEFRIHIVYKKSPILSATVVVRVRLIKLADGRIKFGIGA